MASTEFTTGSGTSITIEYDSFGAEGDPALLLVNGLGSQMINWDVPFCELLVAAGFRVVRFDNRDVGLSSKTTGDPPDTTAIFRRFRKGEPIGEVPYTLADMASDGIAVLDAAGIDRAHIVGMSMGGMIVQRMAIDHPGRVLSMTSIMSTTGQPGAGQATPEAAESLTRPPATSREQHIEDALDGRRITGGAHFDEPYWREQITLGYERNFHPLGSAFQMAAVASDGDRTAELRALDCPTLVIHGRMDPLVTLSGGEATAAAVPDAELLVLDDMGHDVPEPLWPTFVEAIVGVAERAGD